MLLDLDERLAHRHRRAAHHRPHQRHGLDRRAASPARGAAPRRPDPADQPRLGRSPSCTTVTAAPAASPGRSPASAPAIDLGFRVRVAATLGADAGDAEAELVGAVRRARPRRRPTRRAPGRPPGRRQRRADRVAGVAAPRGVRHRRGRLVAPRRRHRSGHEGPRLPGPRSPRPSTRSATSTGPPHRRRRARPARSRAHETTAGRPHERQEPFEAGRLASRPTPPPPPQLPRGANIAGPRPQDLVISTEPTQRRQREERCGNHCCDGQAPSSCSGRGEGREPDTEHAQGPKWVETRGAPTCSQPLRR